jgi:hypothetical protein
LIDSVADIRIQDAAALNAGNCHFSVHLDVTTDPGCGGYSALVPVLVSNRHKGPAVFRCDLNVQSGSVGLSAVTSDGRIIAERVATKIGRQTLEILVPEPAKVAGIMVRNLAVTSHPSRVIILGISAETYPVEKFLNIRQDRPHYMLRLPVRKQSDGPLQEIGEPVNTVLDLDTGKTATIVIDAWDVLQGRVALNIADKLAPTLAALRSTSMAILHAAHDRDIHPLARPLAGETQIPGEIHIDVIASIIADVGIRNLIYLGYFSNMCIIQRSVGMLEMQKRGFNTILVRDASLAKESVESVAGEWFHKATVHFVELNFGASTTSEEIQAAVAISDLRVRA